MRLPIGIGHRTLCRAPSAAPVIPLTPQNLGADFPALPPARALSFQEAIGARIAWQYFVNNTQASGLVNALDRQSYVSLWSIGDQLMATLAAERLGIISRAEFDRRLTATLQALATLPLSARQLPWQYYDSISLRPYPQQDEGASPGPPPTSAACSARYRPVVTTTPNRGWRSIVSSPAGS
ncbi:DUF3131 domain-containing protein [Edwardsiella tarda]